MPIPASAALLPVRFIDIEKEAMDWLRWMEP
jgi:hypothetical protein